MPEKGGEHHGVLAPEFFCHGTAPWSPPPSASTHLAVNGHVLIMRRCSTRLPLAWLAFRLCNSAGALAPDAARRLRVAASPSNPGFPGVIERVPKVLSSECAMDAMNRKAPARCSTLLSLVVVQNSALHPAQHAVPGRFQVRNPGGSFQIYHSRLAASVNTAILPLRAPPESCPQTASCSTTAGTQPSIADCQTGPS